MRSTRALCLVWLLAACAAHNAHRVPIDLNADLAPQIDEAWANMEAALGGPVPVGGVAVEVVVESVAVQWLPHSPEVPPGGSVIPQAELRHAIEDVLQPKVAPQGPHAGRLVRVKLAVDLHEPDALETQVRCALLDPAGERLLAQGRSGLVRFERLYCHGCRDHLGGHGSSLTAPTEDDGEYVGAGFFSAGVFLSCPTGSSPGYTKH